MSWWDEAPAVVKVAIGVAVATSVAGWAYVLLGLLLFNYLEK